MLALGVDERGVVYLNSALLVAARPADLLVLGGHAGGEVRPIATVEKHASTM